MIDCCCLNSIQCNWKFWPEFVLLVPLGIDYHVSSGFSTLFAGHVSWRAWLLWLQSKHRLLWNSVVLEGSLCCLYYLGHYTLCILEGESNLSFRPDIPPLGIGEFQLSLYHYYNRSTEYVWRNCFFYDSILYNSCIV